MKKIKRAGLWLLLKFTQEKIHIWRGLAIVVAKLEPYAWVPENTVMDIKAHIAGLTAEADRLQKVRDWGIN